MWGLGKVFTYINKLFDFILINTKVVIEMTKVAATAAVVIAENVVPANRIVVKAELEASKTREK